MYVFVSSSGTHLTLYMGSNKTSLEILSELHKKIILDDILKKLKREV